MDIFEIAGENSDNLKRSYCLLEDRCNDQDEIDILDKFARTIKDEWTISINIGPRELTHFLILGFYMNIYEKKERDKENLKEYKSVIPVEEAVEKHLGDNYERRAAFERLFGNGKKFRYGALNIGGLGLRKFGEFCVVIKRKQSRNYVSLAFIKRDSLDYVDRDQVDVERLRQNVADRESVHFLACLKHEDDIKRIPSDEWASSICRDGCYIEAVTMDDILNNHIECIRIGKEEHDHYYNVHLYNVYESKSSDYEELRLYEFLNIQELSRQLGIKIKRIEK